MSQHIFNTQKNDFLNKIAKSSNNELFSESLSEWMVDAVETHETIEHFIDSSKKYWSESTVPVLGTFAGFNCIVWRKMQPHKGAQRDSLSVIDLGEIRIALKGTDLMYFEFVKF